METYRIQRILWATHFCPGKKNPWKPWPGILHAAQAPALRVRASFSQERMNYHRGTGQVEYRSKDGKETKIFDALEWSAAMCSHVPNKGESRRGRDFIRSIYFTWFDFFQQSPADFSALLYTESWNRFSQTVNLLFVRKSSSNNAQ